MGLKEWMDEQHARRMERIKAEGKKSYIFYPMLDLGQFGIALIFVVLMYGLFVAPCSFELSGKFTGNISMDNPTMNRAGIDGSIHSFEGSVKGNAPCLAWIMMAKQPETEVVYVPSPIVNKLPTIPHQNEIPLGA